MGEMPAMELIQKGKLEQTSYFLALKLFLVRTRNPFIKPLVTVNNLKELQLKLNVYLDLHQFFEVSLNCISINRIY